MIVDRYSKIVLTVIAAALVVIAARPLLPEWGLRTWLLPEAALAQTAAAKYEVVVPKAWGKFIAEPDWRKLSTTPGYTDAEIVTSINTHPSPPFVIT